MNATDKYIENATRLSFKDQAFNNRYYARLVPSIQCEIFRRHRKILHMMNQKQQEQIPIYIISYASFILAIQSYKLDEQRISSKNFDDLELEEVQRLSILKIMKYKGSKQKKVTKRSQIIGIAADISTALSNGLSYRDLTHYIFKEHQIRAKKSTIFDVCKELGLNTRKTK